ncbi:MAG TPA: metalloregulator ArsR/SmtB family transcription factor [Candidatus Baltobacteraceae bacterium]|nr:metalloregulator ArsR/SmtB family transcription factor [Candidatus Baltobacteraceae bacterium]
MKKANGRRQVRKALFSMLSNQTRVDILLTLNAGEKNVSQLVKELGIGQPLISHNLRILSRAGFLHVRKDGNFRFYKTNRDLAAPFLVALDTSRMSSDEKGRSALLGVIVEQAPVTVLVIDTEGVLVFAGGDFKQRFGLQEKDLKGRPVLEVFIASDGAIRRALDGRRADWTIEHGGRAFRVASNGYKNGDGRHDGIIGVVYGGAIKPTKAKKRTKSRR